MKPNLTLSRDFIEYIEDHGWMFSQAGPNEWEWLKFDDDGRCIDRMGGESWHREETNFFRSR